MAKFIDVIMADDLDNQTFVWKHPSTDFNTNSQLVVHESQEAIFFSNGQALQTFGPGRYNLETQNFPFIKGLIKGAVTGGQSPFHCDVYFINKTVQMAIKWGTPDKVRFIEPNYGFPIEIGASGELNLAVSDSRKLLIKLVGTTSGIAWGEGRENFTKSLQNCFRPLIASAVKTNLSNAILESKIDVLEIDQNLEILSKVLKNAINPGFEEYGLTIPEFFLTTVALPQRGDPSYDSFEQFYKLHTANLRTKSSEVEGSVRAAEVKAKREAEIEQARLDAELQYIRAQGLAEAGKVKGFAEAEVMKAQGYNKKDEFQKDVQIAYAEGLGNMTITGGGSVAGDMIGLGVGMAAAGHMAPHMGEMFKGYTPQEPTAPIQEEIKCAKCGASVAPNAKFCPECGEKIVNLAENEIICPACGEKTQKGKFCQECGAPLIRKCPKCGVEIPNGAKFCLECGEKL